jgi:NarL family two-component system response regulator LiaR
VTGRISVLLVDDHLMFAEALQMLLSGEDEIEVVGAVCSAEEAIELAEREHPTVALVDIELPGMDGIETTARLKEVSPSTQVVAVSAHLDRELIARILQAGASGFIPKTHAADALIATVKQAAEGGVVLPLSHFASLLSDLESARRSRTDARRVLALLTPREIEILQVLAEGKSTREVAQSLRISVMTVQSHVKNILGKLGARSKVEAVTLALRHGIIGIDRLQAAPPG